MATSATAETTDAGPDESAPVDLRADHLGAFLLAVGIGAIAALASTLIRAIAPGWPISPVLPVVCFGLALMAFYRHRWTRLHRPFGNRTPIYLAELILLVVVTRLASFALEPWRLIEVLPRWWRDQTAILDVGFLLDVLLVAGAWLVGHTVGSAVDQLHVQPGELRPSQEIAHDDLWERAQSAFDHRAAQRQIGTIVSSGIAVVVILLALVAVARPPTALLVEATIATIVALAAGLFLLGWSNVTLLDTLWRLDRLPVPTALNRHWPAWLLAVVIGVGLLALLLPRTFVVDPLVLLGWLLAVVTGLVQLLMFLLILPFIWLASLFGFGGGGGASGGPPPILPVAEQAPTDWSLFDTLRSLAFWVITAALVVYAVRTLYQSQWGLLRHLPRLPVWSTLSRLWRSLVDRLRQGATGLAAVVRAAMSPRATRASMGQRPSRLPRPTDSRGLVQFLYMSLVDRAGRRGLPRRRGMTAAEYSRFLAARLATDDSPPDQLSEQSPSSGGASAVVALDTLTVAFLEARYSRHTVGENDVGRARGALQRLLQLLRQRRSGPSKRIGPG